MDQISPFSEDDDDSEMDGHDASAARAAGVSHEFIQYHNAGMESVCWAPWRMLKVDIRSRTSVCCSFAHKLPKFDWPTARTFHDEAGMWNHPYMQHMRRTMGKDDELPFCKVCRETDKRDVRNLTTRREAMHATQTIYNGMLETIAAKNAKGAVDLYVLNPSAFEARLTTKVNAAVMHSVTQGRLTQRKLLRARSFDTCRRILQIGALNGAVTPFLAETAESVTLVADHSRGLERVRGIADVLGFDNIQFLTVPDMSAFPFDDGAFDGIWLDGQILSLIGRSVLLAEISRMLAPNGRVCAVRCLGPGGLIEHVVDGHIRRIDAEAALAGGVPYGGRGSFMTSITVLDALKESGLVSDRTSPPVGVRFNGDTGEPTLRTDYAELARHLDPANWHPDFLEGAGATWLKGVERFVAFTALANSQARKHAAGGQIGALPRA